MATLTPTLAGIGQATIGDLPVAIVDLSVPNIAINDTISMSSEFQQLVNQALLDAGIISVCSIVTSSQVRFDELTFSSGATFDSGYIELSANQRIYETSNRAYEREYWFRYLSGSTWTYFAGSTPHQGASGYAVSMAYSVIFRVNGNYVGMRGASGSLSFYDSNASHNPNPFGNGTRNGVIIGLPSPSKTYAATHTIQVNNLNVEIPDIEIKSADPYEQGGTTGTGGGTGTFDGTGDDISIPGLPTLSAVDAGFITLFNPSVSELASLATYMWSNPLFDLDAWKKIFADPMDAILGLSIVPVSIPNGGTKTVTVGNISTGVSMTTAQSQYVSVDCGTLNVNEFWGAYLDYDPYTKAEIYLPYIGTHPIATDDIMGKSVHVVYHVDILSGGCTAFVQCGSSVLYQFVGQCAISVPITGDNWTNVVNGAISIAGAIGTMVATGGASAPMAAGAIAETAVNTMKPSIEKSGAMGGPGGMLAVQTPYLILTRPRQALPERQNEFSGYPSFITMELENCSGYTEIDAIHLENISATEQELSEIESLLKSGVIF